MTGTEAMMQSYASRRLAEHEAILRKAKAAAEEVLSEISLCFYTDSHGATAYDKDEALALIFKAFVDFAMEDQARKAALHSMARETSEAMLEQIKKMSATE